MCNPWCDCVLTDYIACGVSTEASSGDRESYGGGAALLEQSEEAAKQEEEFGALVTLIAYCDKHGRW